VAALSIAHSYSAGVVGWFVAKLAAEGLVALAFANSSASIAPWGGRKAMFGTNPIGFAAPREVYPPIIVDMASSATARVNIVQAAARGEQVPPGWVFDNEGKPTTEPQALLAGGSVGPLGGAKGYGLALIVELLAAALTGASFSYQASSFGTNEGGPPDVGQLFIALSPKLTGGEAMGERLEELVGAVEAQPGARLPGDKRHEHRQRAEREGVDVPEDLVAKLKGYAK
jgi:(2R)-3-sulfolactate dehydrogenase (NADP+)